MTFAPFTAALTLFHVADGVYAFATVAPAAAAALAARSAMDRYASERLPTGPTMIATFPPAALAGAGDAARTAALRVTAAMKAAPIRSRNKGVLEGAVIRRGRAHVALRARIVWAAPMSAYGPMVRSLA